MIAFQGDGVLKRIRVKIGKHLIDAEVPEWIAPTHHFNIGQEVHVILKMGKIMVNEG